MIPDTKLRKEESDKIADQTEEFLLRGNEITEVIYDEIEVKRKLKKKYGRSYDHLKQTKRQPAIGED